MHSPSYLLNYIVNCITAATDVAAILVELQNYHRHRMITQQLVTTLNPGLLGRAKPSTNNKGTAAASGAGAGDAANKERNIKLEPPDLEKILNALKCVTLLQTTKPVNVSSNYR
jgi:hypothetical protein